MFASGIDENGNSVSNYVLGKGLIEILQADGTITPDAPSYYVHLLDEEPDQPKEGDMWQDTDYIWYIYQNGHSYQLDKKASDIANDAYDVAIQAYGKADDLETLVPAQASTQNQLADKSFVNSSVQTETANFRGNWETWADVPTNVNLYPEDYAGSSTPTVNDYLVVQDASGYVDPDPAAEPLEGTWRLKYSGTWATRGKEGWLPEYQVNETPMTAAQLAAINSNITAAKVAQYDEAMTKFNYAIVDAQATYQPSLLDSLFPMVYTPEGASTSITISKSELTIQWTPEDNVYDIVYDGDSIFYTDSDGYFEDMTDGGSITFAGVAPTTSTQVIAIMPSSYTLQDRAVNSITINPSTAACSVEMPTPTQGRARDFIVRMFAVVGLYQTQPTISTSGVTLMNAEGAMPEIATDAAEAKTTLLYFSEIARNIFLVKGEALEAIS